MSATGVRPAGTEATDFAAEDDGELIRQIASGSTGAFEELHERYHGRAYRLARSIYRARGGYNTVLLGGGIPDDALSAALLRHRPAMVALSSTMASPDALAATCAVIHQTLPAAQLVIGGAAARKPLQNVPARCVHRLDSLPATVEGMLDRERLRGQRPSSSSRS